MARLDVGPGSTVLDLGCGSGRPAVAVARDTGARVIAVDINPRALEAAAAHARAEGVADLVEVRWCDGNDLPFPRDSFDAVLSFESSAHFELTPLLARTARVLRPGGRHVFEGPFLRTAPDADLSARMARFCRALRVPSIHTLDGYRSAFRANGFREAEFLDITPRVRASFTRLAERLAADRRGLAADYGADAAADLLDTFTEYARITEIGAAIIVAAAPPGGGGVAA